MFRELCVIITTLLYVAGCSSEPEYKPPLDAVEATQVATSSKIDQNS
jgi:hypothetical protein